MTGRQQLEDAAERWESVLGEDHPAWGRAVETLLDGVQQLVADAREEAERASGLLREPESAPVRQTHASASDTDVESVLGALGRVDVPTPAGHLAQLTGLTGPAVTAALRTLVADGRAVKTGHHRGSRYALVQTTAWRDLSSDAPPGIT